MIVYIKNLICHALIKNLYSIMFETEHNSDAGKINFYTSKWIILRLREVKEYKAHLANGQSCKLR